MKKLDECEIEAAADSHKLLEIGVMELVGKRKEEPKKPVRNDETHVENMRRHIRTELPHYVIERLHRPQLASNML
jgi:hypothetical protein